MCEYVSASASAFDLYVPSNRKFKLSNSNQTHIHTLSLFVECKIRIKKTSGLIVKKLYEHDENAKG